MMDVIEKKMKQMQKRQKKIDQLIAKQKADEANLNSQKRKIRTKNLIEIGASMFTDH